MINIFSFLKQFSDLDFIDYFVSSLKFKYHMEKETKNNL
jgi:hypothetical protein